MWDHDPNGILFTKSSIVQIIRFFSPQKLSYFSKVLIFKVYLHLSLNLSEFILNISANRFFNFSTYSLIAYYSKSPVYTSKDGTSLAWPVREGSCNQTDGYFDNLYTFGDYIDWMFAGFLGFFQICRYFSKHGKHYMNLKVFQNSTWVVPYILYKNKSVFQFDF